MVRSKRQFQCQMYQISNQFSFVRKSLHTFLVSEMGNLETYLDKNTIPKNIYTSLYQQFWS